MKTKPVETTATTSTILICDDIMPYGDSSSSSSNSYPCKAYSQNFVAIATSTATTATTNEKKNLERFLKQNNNDNYANHSINNKKSTETIELSSTRIATAATSINNYNKNNNSNNNNNEQQSTYISSDADDVHDCHANKTTITSQQIFTNTKKLNQINLKTTTTTSLLSNTTTTSLLAFLSVSDKTIEQEQKEQNQPEENQENQQHKGRAQLKNKEQKIQTKEQLQIKTREKVQLKSREQNQETISEQLQVKGGDQQLIKELQVKSKEQHLKKTTTTISTTNSEIITTPTTTTTTKAMGKQSITLTKQKVYKKVTLRKSQSTPSSFKSGGGAGDAVVVPMECAGDNVSNNSSVNNENDADTTVEKQQLELSENLQQQLPLVQQLDLYEHDVNMKTSIDIKIERNDIAHQQQSSMQQQQTSQQQQQQQSIDMNDGSTAPTTTVVQLNADLRFGCSHYKRRAMFVTPCCNKFYKCRFCHDENESHHFDRKTLTELICSECNTRQKVQEQCENCGVRFGKYTCLICNLFDDTDKKQYHCADCGICRIGGAENFFHCEVCNMCLPIRLQIEGHRCVENISRSHCPVCLGDIHTSRIPCHIPDCGHLLHKTCFDQLLASGHYVCPTCQTSLIDMTALWEYLDAKAVYMPIPKKYENQRIHIFCNDCHKTSKTKFNFIGLKCMQCGAYNTTQDIKRRMSFVADEASSA